jgi:hypothetical protein
MGTSLNGTTPQNTYPSLIKVGDNGAVDATLQRLSDGQGNDLPLLISTTDVTNYGGGGVTSNTAFGSDALTANTTGANNVAIGDSALSSNTTGGSNVAIGREAALNNTGGAGNFALGFNSLLLNANGSNNVAIGTYTLFRNTASNNVAIGRDAAFTNTSGTGITAIGKKLLMVGLNLHLVKVALKITSIVLQTKLQCKRTHPFHPKLHLCRGVTTSKRNN